MRDGLVLTLFALVLLAAFLLLRWRTARRRARPGRGFVVIDGSNVMHWRDSTPGLDPVIAALRLLESRGYQAGVIFDANAGHLLAGRYLHDHHFHRLLGISEDRVMVVPKGTQADPFLLSFATDMRAIIVSNDRFRDRIAGYPDLSQPGRLIRGGWRDGALWLDLPDP
jgi:hypothetical protein